MWNGEHTLSGWIGAACAETNCPTGSKLRNSLRVNWNWKTEKYCCKMGVRLLERSNSPARVSRLRKRISMAKRKAKLLCQLTVSP